MTLELEIVRDLAVIMTIASAVTLLFYILRQPIVLGYLLVGILISPYTLPFSFIAQIDILKVFAELGIILLIFAIGIEFPIAKLHKISKASLGIAILEIMLLLIVGYLIGLAFNWSFFDAIFLAAALSISSTAIIIKVLEDYRILNQESSIIILGVSLIEDGIAVIMIASLQSLVTLGVIVPLDLLFSFLKMALFIGGTLLFGSLFIPKLIDRIIQLNKREITIISSLGLCFALSFLASLIGFSLAIGAFLAGVLVAESKSARLLIQSTEPLKEMFAALFFISMGALININLIYPFLLPTILITLASIGAKIFGVAFGVRLFGFKALTSIRAGLGMVARGEFSLIIVNLGQSLNIVSSFLFPLVGLVVTITTLLTPYLIRFGIELKKSHS